MKSRKAKAAPRPRDDFDYRGFGHRLRVTRIALGLTEEQAAAAAGRTVATWRKYEATGKGNCTGAMLVFAKRYDVKLDWIFGGVAARLGSHLARHSQGTVAILPVQRHGHVG